MVAPDADIRAVQKCNLQSGLKVPNGSKKKRKRKSVFQSRLSVAFLDGLNVRVGITSAVPYTLYAPKNVSVSIAWYELQILTKL